MGWVCCFCGQNISEADEHAVQFAVTNLLRPSGVQALFSHGACAESAIKAAPFDSEALAEA